MKKIRNAYLQVRQKGDNDPDSGMFDKQVSADIDGCVGLMGWC